MASVSPQTTLATLAQQASAPLFAVSRLSNPHTLDLLAQTKPDLISVACFPRLLPPEFYTLAPYGALNLHPSLLPAYRGPEPLFWIFHDDLSQAGVTVHRINAGIDTGPILVQQAVSLSPEIRYGSAEQHCAEAGATLLLDTIKALMNGHTNVRPQELERGSYARFPTQDDCTITPAWSAARAYTFVHGLAGTGYQLFLELPAARYLLHDALAFTHEGTLPAPWQQHNSGVLEVRCSAGTLLLSATQL